jgi:hypothetical protein
MEKLVMSRTFLVAALLAATTALTATPTFAAPWHHRTSARYETSRQAVSMNDPTQYLVQESIPVQDHHTPGITPSAASASAAVGSYAYEPPAAHRRTAFGNDPTMYAIRNSIPEVYPHVPGIGARP